MDISWNNLLMLVMVLCTYLVWLGIRCLGLIGLLTAKKPMLKAFFLGAIFSLFGSTLIALSIRAKYLDSRGNILRDGTFDVEQLIRSSFYIVTIVSAIGLFYYILNSEKKIVRNVVSVLAGLWCLLAFVNLASTQSPKTAPMPLWYTENYSLLKSGKLNDGLIAINPVASPFGIMISSSDYGRYWTAMGQGVGSYNGYPLNSYRWDMFAQLLAHPGDSILNAIKKEGVKYIIATPSDSSQVAAIAAVLPLHLRKLENSNWVFELR